MKFFKLLLLGILASPSLFAQTDSAGSVTSNDDSTSYALLYVYRPNFAGGSAISYNLYNGDSLLCRVKNNSKFIIKLFKEGSATIWAKSGIKYQVELNVKFGESYYLFCGLKAGFPHSTPYLAVKDEGVGHPEFEMVKGRKDKKEDKEEKSSDNK